MKNSIKIQSVENYRNSGFLVTRGKLVLIESKIPLNSVVYINEGTKGMIPIIVSETEKIEIRDNVWDNYRKVIMEAPDKSNADFYNMSLHRYNKVLCFSDNFPKGTLQDIVEDKLKDGDVVFVECEHNKLFPMVENHNLQIRITDTNGEKHANVLPIESKIEKECSKTKSGIKFPYSEIENIIMEGYRDNLTAGAITRKIQKLF